MNYLLDTNVISETIKASPHPKVLDWFSEVSDQALFISVLSIGELRKGVERVTNGRKKFRLLTWLESDLQQWFGQRVLPIDYQVAECWGALCAKASSTPPAIDSLLAATAMTHGLVMVTRNVKDFGFAGIDIVNPFT